MLDNLGLNSEDYDMIINRTNILFHSAATLKFLAPLHEAISTNLKATLTVIDMAQKMKKLEVIYIFSNSRNENKTIAYILRPLYIYQRRFLNSLWNI